MKKNVFLLATILCISFVASAQTNPTSRRAPRWLSNMGFWVVEDNIHTPGKYSIYFYNNDKELVYQQKMTNVKLNLSKRKVLFALKQALETSVVAWEQKKANNDSLATPLFVIETRKARNRK